MHYGKIENKRIVTACGGVGIIAATVSEVGCAGCLAAIAAAMATQEERA